LGIDLALLLGPLAEPDVENLIVCEYPNGFVASPALKLGREPLALRDPSPSFHHYVRKGNTAL
jgi:hypothetical protein